MPAKAGIQNYLKTLDSRLRGNDAEGRFKTFYETINIRRSMLGVRCSTFNLFTVTGQAKFHISGAVGLKSGQFNHQETVPFWCSFI